jgi:dipeptidase E
VEGLEFTTLPSIERAAWLPRVEETDALLVCGGDVLSLCHWMRQSGLAELLPSLLRTMVYVGVSAGYRERPRGTGAALTSEDLVFATPQETFT